MQGQYLMAFMVLTALAAFTAHAAPLVVAVPYEGSAPQGRVAVQSEEGAWPATVRGGEVVFVVPEGAQTPEAVKLAAREGEEDAFDVRVEKAGEQELAVHINGEHFTTYNYGDQYEKPFLWPVIGEGGVHITRDWPMEEIDDSRAEDHPHHKSLWTAYGDVNGVDTWGEAKGAGAQRVNNVTWGSGDAYGWIRSANTWVDSEGKPVLGETREYRFYNTPPESRLVDLRVEFDAAHGPATFNDTKEGGLAAVRMRPELSYENGHITNALGDTGEPECWGKPAAWCDYSGELEEAGWRGIAILDHPENLRHPTSWHVRDYGLMGANCFGWSYFSEMEHNKALLPSDNGDYTLEAGEALVFNYRILVHSGDVEDAKVAEHFGAYAEAPTPRVD